jgi:cytosine/creatinine deaminase
VITDQERLALSVAIAEAKAGLGEEGVPIGAALLSSNGAILARGHNRRVQDGDPIAHGEMSCLRAAGRRASYTDLTMVTTLAPCSMCTGAIKLFKIPRVVVGEAASFRGDLDDLQSFTDVVVVDDPECRALMEAFKLRHPELWAEDIAVPHVSRGA